MSHEDKFTKLDFTGSFHRIGQFMLFGAMFSLSSFGFGLAVLSDAPPAGVAMGVVMLAIVWLISAAYMFGAYAITDLAMSETHQRTENEETPEDWNIPHGPTYTGGA